MKFANVISVHVHPEHPSGGWYEYDVLLVTRYADVQIHCHDLEHAAKLCKAIEDHVDGLTHVEIKEQRS